MFSQEGISISASAAPHCGGRMRERAEKDWEKRGVFEKGSEERGRREVG